MQQQHEPTRAQPERLWHEAADLEWRLVLLDRQAWTVLALAVLGAALLLLAGISDVASAVTVGWAAAPVTVVGSVAYALAQRSMRRMQGRLGALQRHRQSPA